MPGAVALPRVGAQCLRILRNRVPAPLELARDRIESANLSARLAYGTVVGDARANNHRIADDSGGRRFLVIGKIARRDAQAVPQIDDAVVAEIRRWLAGRGIESDQACVDRSHEHT